MISIITSIHNQLAMNRLFLETLRANTKVPFELIIIDNNSTDGSREYFQKEGVVVIANKANYSYPYCQNQGIRKAKYDYLAFFNNDLLVTKNWDERILNILKKDKVEVVSFATNDHMESAQAQKETNRTWKRMKYFVRFFYGTSYSALKWMVKLTYGDLDRFNEKRFQKFGDKTVEAFSGSCIMFHKNVITKIGEWDERIQAADFDIFNRTKKRFLEKGDILPIQLALGIYFHHFQRLTVKSVYPPFEDKANLIKLDEKWGKHVTEELQKDIVR